MLKYVRCRLAPLALALPLFVSAGCGQDASELYQEAVMMEKSQADRGYSQQEILQKFDEAAKAGSTDAMLHLAGIFCESGQLAGCREYLPEVRRKNPALADFYAGISDLAQTQEEKAVEELKSALQGGERRAAYYLAELYYRQYAVKEAVGYYETALKAGDRRAALPLVRIYLNSKNPASNVRGFGILKDILKQEPHNREALVLSAKAYIQGLGTPVSMERAGEIIRTLGAANPSPDVVIVRSLYQIASNGESRDTGIATLKSLIQNSMNPEAAYILYDIYSRGLYGVEKNQKEAIYYVRIASDGGLPKGMLALGEMYRLGLGVNPNNDESFRLTRKALDAEPDLVDAMVLLGRYHAEGIGTRVDPREAYRYYQEAAESGSQQAEYEGALLVLKGLVPEANFAEAMNTFRKLADAGLPEAAFQYGHILFLGNGVPRNMTLAEEYLRKAVDKGIKEAFMPYATVLDFRGDYDNAILWYKVLADESIGTEVSAEAAARLGEIYDILGRYRDARRYYEQAYNAGIAAAGINLARLYFIDGDYPKAVAIFSKEANEGNPVAATFMGLMYDQGKGLPINEIKAQEWYDKAVRKGNVDAMYLEGKLLHSGKTIPEHMAAGAQNLLESAACHGNEQAAIYLGTVFYPLDSEFFDVGAAWLRYASEKLESKKAQDFLSKAQVNGGGNYDKVLARCNLKN